MKKDLSERLRQIRERNNRATWENALVCFGGKPIGTLVMGTHDYIPETNRFEGTAVFKVGEIMTGEQILKATENYDLESLNRLLEDSLLHEDFEMCAKIRDAINSKME